ncbi:hypothetical protein F9278_27900 [Streptomyces phaeolivaceus]|uniref:Uncharacterized protein n=1 Tax=Streptomyces phaeolivaceus TaxID=2653200 RepID=A0A5P8K969_9ACTN|nr:hypothetical protein [Streptomyces phaeolivaceus]QFQ99338.1 hypothetical protein F9278_27900 [Streptomyces phaeolivaceus]
MSVWSKPAAERVASLREQYASADVPVADLSDLELLNAAYESVLREQIDTRDRYMGLLTELRKHDDAVRKAATRALSDHAERYAHRAVNEYMRPFNAVLYRIENLPDRPGPRQVEGLRQAADRVQFQLRNAPNHPAELNDPESARQTLRAIHRVVGVLDGRQGLNGDDVLRLVKNALNDEAPTDLFAVADRGTPKPTPPTPNPPFAGPGWADLGGFWAYQPGSSGAHVKAYPVGEDWYLDLWSDGGQLLAFGSVPETEVGALAPALVARADDWARDRSEYAWRRFADTAQAARTTGPGTGIELAPAPGRAQAPSNSRLHAATATSPARPPSATAASPARASTGARPASAAAPRRSR